MSLGETALRSSNTPLAAPIVGEVNITHDEWRRGGGVAFGWELC